VFDILTVTTPFFLLVLAGYVATRLSMLPVSAISGLNSFVLYFSLPCMLFRFGAMTPIDQLLNLELALIYLVCGLLVVATALMVSRARHLDWNNSAFGALVTAFPNTGFMGVPLLLALMGQESTGPVIVTIFIDLVIVSSLCIGISRLTPGTGQSLSHIAKNVAKRVASNPMPWAICAGALASAFDLAPPPVIDATIDLMANSASPVALFTIGAVLARSVQLDKSGEHSHSPIPVTTLAAMKLLLHPALLFAALHIGNWLGAAFDRHTMTVVILVAALPSASNVAILAERFAADSAQIARIIMVSTAIAFLSFPATFALLR
jgi:hypothetical protein